MNDPPARASPRLGIVAAICRPSPGTRPGPCSSCRRQPSDSIRCTSNNRPGTVNFALTVAPEGFLSR